MEIPRAKMDAMLLEVPEDKRDDFLADFKKRGYTVGLPQSSSGQNIYPEQAERSKLGMAWEAGQEPVPGLDQAGKFLSETAPGYISEKSGEIGAGLKNKGFESAGEGVEGAGLAASMALGTAGELVPRKVFDVGVQTLAEPVALAAKAIAPIAGKTIAPIARASGDILAELAGTWTGRSPEAFKEVFKTPSIMKKVSQQVGTAEQAKFVKAIDEGITAIGKKFETVQDSIAGFPGTPSAGKNLSKVNTRQVSDRVSRELVSKGHRVPYEISGIKPIVEGVFKTDSPEYATINGWLQKLNKNESRDFGEVLNLRRQLDNEINYGPPGGQGIKLNDKANGVLKRLRGQLDEALSASLPAPQRKAWDEANAAVSQALKAKAELRKQVVGETPEQTTNRIIRQIKTGRAVENLEGKASKIGESAVRALDEIHDRVVARQFKDYVSGHGGGALGVLTTTSPRLLGNIAASAGSNYQAMQRAAQSAMAHPQALGIAINEMLKKYGPDGSK